jgi:hypothetical protein
MHRLVHALVSDDSHAALLLLCRRLPYAKIAVFETPYFFASTDGLYRSQANSHMR